MKFSYPYISSAKLHARSVARHLGVKEGLIYLPGQPSYEYEDSDQPEFFRQRRYFYYLSGINFPDAVVTYNIQRDRLIAFIPPQNTGTNVIYNGFNPTRQEVEARSDFDQVALTNSLGDYLKHFAHREYGSIFALHKDQSPAGVATNLMQGRTPGYLYGCPVETSKLKGAMDAARVIKSPYEIKMMRKANSISAQAHINVLRSIKYLENEAEIEAIFSATCTAGQAKQQSYGIIAGSGENASTLHYVANNEPLKGRQLVCLDAGCEWECYASDVTRTFPISGEYTTEAKEIYDLVTQMQDECIEMVKPGAIFLDIHLHAITVATAGLLKLGLLRDGTYEEIFKSRAAVAFFPHGLGHFMGLEVHDVGDGGNLLLGRKMGTKFVKSPELSKDLGAMATATVLEPNMVITVEPGIYFSRYALNLFSKDSRFGKYITKDEDLLEKYYPVGGVRIEDDILVTEDGYENLTTAPKGEKALKIINEGKGKPDQKQKWGWLW